MKHLSDRELTELYGKPLSWSEKDQYFQYRTKEITTSDKRGATFDKLDWSEFAKQGRSEAEEILKDQRKTIIDSAKVWLKDRDLEVFREKNQKSQVKEKPIIVRHLRDEIGLTFPEMAELIGSLIGEKLNHGGLYMMYRYRSKK